MKTRALIAATVAVLAVVVTFATLVWPTSYVIVTHDGTVSRVNRFTGVQEYSSPQGWIRPGVPQMSVSAKDVTGSLVVKDMHYDPHTSQGELVLLNSTEEAWNSVHVELSLLDGDGVVVGTTTQDVEKIGKGDRVRLSIVGYVTSGAPTQIRVDRVYKDWTPGATVAAR